MAFPQSLRMATRCAVLQRREWVEMCLFMTDAAKYAKEGSFVKSPARGRSGRWGWSARLCEDLNAKMRGCAVFTQ